MQVDIWERCVLWLAEMEVSCVIHNQQSHTTLYKLVCNFFFFFWSSKSSLWFKKKKKRENKTKHFFLMLKNNMVTVDMIENTKR